MLLTPAGSQGQSCFSGAQSGQSSNNPFPHYSNCHCPKHLHKPKLIVRPPREGLDHPSLRPTCYQSACLQAERSKQVFLFLFQSRFGIQNKQ